MIPEMKARWDEAVERKVASGRTVRTSSILAANEHILHLEAENARLREENGKLKEALRWRKYPEERPEGSGAYLVSLVDVVTVGWYRFTYNSWLVDGEKRDGIISWRPLPTTPEESRETK
jgi:hypothetical protein